MLRKGEDKKHRPARVQPTYTLLRYILTNRHVVGAGPFWGYVVFDNHEEVDAYPVYRDPVHDFGILRFDPKAIKYMPVAALDLRPDLAKGNEPQDPSLACPPLPSITNLLL
jgi:S1-C subfamily serine protease